MRAGEVTDMLADNATAVWAGAFLLAMVAFVLGMPTVTAGIAGGVGLVHLALLRRINERRKVAERDALSLRTRLGQLLEHAMYIDLETRLGNRRQLERDAAKARARQRRHGEPTSLAFVEVCYATRQDATLETDTVRFVARLLLQSARTEDSVYRTGQNTFAVLLAVSDVHGAIAFRDRFLDTLGGTLVPMGDGSSFLLSRVGVAEATDRDWTADDLYDEARANLEAVELANRRIVGDWKPIRERAS